MPRDVQLPVRTIFVALVWADPSKGIGGEEATRYRNIVTRCNFKAVDMLDLQYTVRMLYKGMATPFETGWGFLRHLGKYVKRVKRLSILFAWTALNRASQFNQTMIGEATGNHGVGQCSFPGATSWSKEQSQTALNSGEAELHVDNRRLRSD